MEAVAQWPSLLAYAFLYLSLLLLWMPGNFKVPAWGIVFTAACFLGWLGNLLDLYAVVPMLLLAAALRYTEQENLAAAGRAAAGITVLITAYALGAHLIPYFHNLLLLANVRISSDGVPFTMYLNFDKAIVGLFVLGLTHRLLADRDEWREMLRNAGPLAVLLVVLLAFLALFSGKLDFDPKLPDCWPIWLLTNLLFVCIAEEGFFRGFLQRNLVRLLRGVAGGRWLALTITAVLFGFAHYAGGIAYSIWGTFAGLGYGWIYHKTGKIEASILAHFGLNAVHFLLFTYPGKAI